MPELADDLSNLSSYSSVVSGILYQGDSDAIYLLPSVDLHVRAAAQDPPGKRIPCDTLHIALQDIEANWAGSKQWAVPVMYVARAAARRCEQGDRVLVTCQAGLNRSGLIVALTLCALGLTPDEAVYLVRRQRSAHALFNESFVKAVHALGPKVR